MEIKNFYLLLELPCDPPEEDPEIIDQAIKKKQSEWSRYRNHPTKATLAQQYIGLIPEIREVMSDSKRRRKEARRAQRILLKKEKEKFSQIDGHIRLLISKGEIRKSEIARLADLHAVKAGFIRKRIKKKAKYFRISRQVDRLIQSGRNIEKKQAKLAKAHNIDPAKLQKWVEKRVRERDDEIDQYLRRCNQRGHITDQEISLMCQIYSVKEDLLLKRIRCAIRKKGEVSSEPPRPIDKTIEKLISDKLKVVGKTSLYDFLNLTPESDIEILKKRALEKEADVRRIGQKDAVTTASGALAGHCLTIFKTEQSRQAYDLSLVRSRMGNLNTDINAAGFSGKIWPEYIQILVRRAVRLGMDIVEARDHIEAYCRDKHWQIEKKKLSPEKKRLRIAIAASAIAIVLITVSVVMAVRFIKASQLRNAYETALAEAEKQSALEAKEVILKNFVKYHPPGEYTAQAEEKIKQIRQRITERDYQEALAATDQALMAGEPEKAKAAAEQYLRQYPATPHKADMQKRIAEAENRIDEKDFRILKAVSRQDYEKLIRAYKTYFEKHPQGNHIEEAKHLIANTVKRHFEALKQELTACDEQSDWPRCIALCDAFIEKFGGTDQATATEGLKGKYKNKIQNQSDLVKMKQMAREKGTDYEAARAIYLEYLEANPELASALKKLIVAEIKVFDQKIEAQKRAEEAWEKVLTYTGDRQAALSAKISQVNAFLRNHPETRHTEEAKALVARLREEKAIEDERIRAERESREWQELVGYTTDNQIPLAQRIRRVERYISENPAGRHIKNARLILSKLTQQQQIEAERLRLAQTYQVRRQQERNRIKRIIAASAGRFTDNGNDTLTDRRTGLTWYIFDAAFELNGCQPYQSASQYVEKLTAGGHEDWRMPTLTELESILISRPVFPSGRSQWLWSSDVFWHGWNKRAHGFMAASPTTWRKDAKGVEQCGSVLAVRP